MCVLAYDRSRDASKPFSILPFVGFISLVLGGILLMSEGKSKTIGNAKTTTYNIEGNFIYRIECAFLSGTNNYAVLQKVVLSPTTMERVPVQGDIRFWHLDEKLPAIDGEYVVAVITADGKMKFEKHPLTQMEKAETKK